ncbi:hypothetical protein KJ039_06985 [bacterium]|nr:hypothetical protein [bacterium]
MVRAVLPILMLIMLYPVPLLAELQGERVKFDLGPEAYSRGMGLYMQHCVACHGLKYLRGPDAPDGISPALDPESAQAAFGVVPPDLTLMASARGKGLEGVEYLYNLLTTYYIEDGEIRNRAFAEETHTEGAIAMPPPIPMDDPELSEKSRDIAAFLYLVSEPSLADRKRLGPWVLGYMALLTAVLYVLNRYTWKEEKRKLKG